MSLNLRIVAHIQFGVTGEESNPQKKASNKFIFGW